MVSKHFKIYQILAIHSASIQNYWKKIGQYLSSFGEKEGVLLLLTQFHLCSPASIFLDLRDLV